MLTVNSDIAFTGLKRAVRRDSTDIKNVSEGVVMETISKRIDHVTEIPEQWREQVVPAPISVKVELTSRCNFGCHFCAHGNGYTNGKDMDFELFKRITKDMRENGVEELGMFYIGESLLYPYLTDAITYAKKELRFPYVFLTTNGSMAGKERVRAIMEAGLDSLKWSLNSADMWQFRQMTSMAPSMFKTVMQNVQDAYTVREEGGYKTRLYASSIRYDGDQLKRMENTIASQVLPYVDEHYWLPLLSFGDTAKKVQDAGFSTVTGNPGRADCMRPPIPCWAVFKEGHVTAAGKLSACCFDSSNAWVMADLTKVSFMEGWNSKDFQALRGKHLSGDCHGTPCEGCLYGN